MIKIVTYYTAANKDFWFYIYERYVIIGHVCYKYADIVVSMPISGIFNYAIPPSLDKSVQIGSRVLVSFKNRNITGYVVGLKKDIADEIKKKVKEIIDVLDHYPVINSELLRLTRWMADYYSSPWGEVIKTAVPIPKNIGKRTLQYVCLANGYNDDHTVSLSPKQKMIVEQLRSAGKATADLAGKVKSPYSAVKILERKGIVTISYKNIFRYPSGSFDTSQPIVNLEQLTKKQKKAYNLIRSFFEKKFFKTLLLHGITGSGKTEIYIHSIQYVIKSGMGAIMLVPEISLTPQLVERFKVYFGDQIAVLHSGLSAGERFDEWRRIREKRAKIAIGTRSAIFAPFDNIGIIIVDEEHDTSYKQSVSPYYNARDCAVVRGKLSNSVVVLGTATPSVESFYNHKIGKYSYFYLPERVKGSSLPLVHIIDKRKNGKCVNNKLEILSSYLIKAIKERIEKKEQSILFLNRRGAAPFLQCIECGYVYICKNCSVSLTFHSVTGRLVCHYCGYFCVPLDQCPSCKGHKVFPWGAGTQSLEDEVRRLFPNVTILRMDKDTVTGKNSYYEAVNRLKKREVDILIGTQIVTKGHDFPGVTLVGVILADISLNLPDFRGGERTFSLLTQAAGRAGRGEQKGEVIIQTYNPGHYSISCVKSHNFIEFYNNEIKFRKEFDYPPFSRIIFIRIESASQQYGEVFKERFKDILLGLDPSSMGVEVLGPSRAVIFKIKNRYRWYVMLKSGNIDMLKQTLTNSMFLIEKGHLKKSNVKLSVDIDPVGLV